jgi:hypothetical protein
MLNPVSNAAAGAIALGAAFVVGIVTFAFTRKASAATTTPSTTPTTPATPGTKFVTLSQLSPDVNGKVLLKSGSAYVFAFPITGAGGQILTWVKNIFIPALTDKTNPTRTVQVIAAYDKGVANPAGFPSAPQLDPANNGRVVFGPTKDRYFYPGGFQGAQAATIWQVITAPV